MEELVFPERIISMFDLLVIRPLGFIIGLIFSLVQNYGFAIILFTILIKLILMPLAIKSQKAMRKQQKIQPYLMELREKYKDDPETLQVKTMKLYKDNNISMTGGCLPLLIQMPILFGLYRVIQQPITYLLGVNLKLPENIAKITDIISRMTAEYSDIIGKLANTKIDEIIKHSQIQLSTWCEILNGPSDPWVIPFNFLGLDLSVVPSKAMDYIFAGQFHQLDRVLLILIPIFAIFTTWLSIRQSQKMTQMQNTNQEANQTVDSMNKSMNLMMPIMTGVFSYILPSGLGLYWIVSNLMQMLQQFLINEYFKRKGDDFDVKLPEENRKNSKKRR